MSYLTTALFRRATKASIPLQCLHGTVILLVSSLFLFSSCHQALAAPVKIDAWVNVPYAIRYGFGSYNVGGITTSTYRIPITGCFPIGPEEDNLTLKFTGYFGYTHVGFETYLLGPKLEINQDYVFALPQLELLIPLESGLILKPYISLGGGYAFNGQARFGGVEIAAKDSYDLLYAAGLGIHYEQRFEPYTLYLGSKLGWAGEEAFDESSDQNFGTFQTGVEIRRPLGITLGDKKPDLAASFIYYRFFPAAAFSMQTEAPLKIENQYEFGLTLGLAKPSKLWFLTDPRIGASHRFGDGLTGFRLSLGFPF